MKLHHILALVPVFALCVAIVNAEETASVKSGPQADEKLAGPFSPLNVNGDKAGNKNCLYCSNGQKPVAMVFARELTPEVTALIKKLDAACVEHKDANLNSFFVFCSDSEGLEGKLKKTATDADLKKVVLSIDNPAGPEGYNVNKDAEVTVVLYVKRTAKVNMAFKKGEFKEKNVDEIIKALPKITKE